ncbi:MAG: phosphoribosylanthranilate isomerase [Candidatus Eiseniibacteriota bacterium]
MAHRTWIKMCGLTRLEDALRCAEAGVDALGFVFAASPRRVTVEQAVAIIRELPPHILRFAVFVDETPAEIARVLAHTDVDRVQIHGFEEPTVHEVCGTRVVKVFRARDETVLREIEETRPAMFLLDTWRRDVAGGTGERFDWDIARRTRTLGRLVLAGGLTPENVGDAVRDVRPFGVDVSTGIETSPGVKDAAKIRAFVEAVRAADLTFAGETSAAS